MIVRHLYVVGEFSPDPENWLPGNGLSLVIARTPEEACELAGEMDGAPVAVILMDESKHLVTMPDEYHGDDDDDDDDLNCWMDPDWPDRSEWVS